MGYVYDERYDRPPPRPPLLAPSPVCVGCEYNKMPYCFAPNSNDMRIDALPPNFICATKSVQKTENVKKKAELIVLISNRLETMDKKLNKILKKIKKWD